MPLPARPHISRTLSADHVQTAASPETVSVAFFSSLMTALRKLPWNQSIFQESMFSVLMLVHQRRKCGDDSASRVSCRYVSVLKTEVRKCMSKVSFLQICTIGAGRDAGREDFEPAEFPASNKACHSHAFSGRRSGNTHTRRISCRHAVVQSRTPKLVRHIGICPCFEKQFGHLRVQQKHFQSHV